MSFIDDRLDCQIESSSSIELPYVKEVESEQFVICSDGCIKRLLLSIAAHVYLNANTKDLMDCISWIIGGNKKYFEVFYENYKLRSEFSLMEYGAKKPFWQSNKTILSQILMMFA